jgi:uncharacterized protein YjbI with pentapeptide repeats
LWNATLSGADLSGANLSNATLSRARLAGANLTDAHVQGADLFSTTQGGFSAEQLYSTASYQSGDLTGVKWNANDLSGWNFAGQKLVGAVFGGFERWRSPAAVLAGADFSGADLQRASFYTSDLRSVNFTAANIGGVNFAYTGISLAQIYSTASYSERDLRDINLHGNNLSGADFTGQNLSGAQFSSATLTGADFSGADIRSANFSGTRLTPSQLTSTASYRNHDLSGVNPGGMALTGIDFSGQIINGADLSGMPVVEDFVMAGWVGLTASQLYSTASYQNQDLSGVILASRVYFVYTGGTGSLVFPFPFPGTVGPDMSGWNFAGQNLRDVDFIGSNLAGADFTGADVRGGAFTGLTLEQLHSTASYRAGDLSGLDARSAFREADFARMNLSNGGFDRASLMEANLDGADLRGVVSCCVQSIPPFNDNLYSAAHTNNAIHPDGHIDGVQLGAGQRLSIRDYDGGGYLESPPLPITVDDYFTNTGGTLRMIFEADEWSSTISFEAGISVALGGTLELTFADGVDLASQIGRTIDLFDWSSVNPTGTFSIMSPYAWDLSNLYTTGEVTLTAVPEPTSCFAVILCALIAIVRSRRRSSQVR